MKQKAKPVVVEVQENKASNELKKTLRKYLPISLKILGVIVVLILITTVVIRYRNEHRGDTGACSTGEGKTLLDQAATELNPKDTYQLTQTGYKIITLKNYQKDPNCTYILTTMEVNMHNIVGAQQYLNEFNKTYNGGNVSSRLTSYKSIDDLRSEVPNIKPVVNGIP